MPKDQLENFNRINGPRVEKMLAILNSIEKSARSQKIDGADVAALLAPLVERLPTDGEAQAEAPAVAPQGDEAPAPKAAPVARKIELGEIKHGDVPKLVSAIPDDMVTSVVTQLVHRMSEAYETRKAA